MPRRVTALIAPFGVPAYRGWWRAVFGPGRLSVSDVGRVPYVFEHGESGRVVVGVMVDVEERPAIGAHLAGVYGTFDVDDTPAGDRAWAELRSGSRSGFSMGLEYDAATLEAIAAALETYWTTGEVTDVDAVAQIREVSHVFMPAFDDARTIALDDVETTDPAPILGAS